MTSDLKIDREQFESANPVPFGVFWSEPDSRYMTTMVHLNCIEYQGKWLGWQSAMRAAPVVERQEPVIYEVRIQEEAGNPEESPFFTDYVTKLGAENYKAHHERVTVTPLYAEQPAPVAHQEPVAYMRNEGTPNNLVKCTFTCPGAFGVYRQSQAPLLPALPSEDSGTYDYGSYSEGRKHGWNACLDKVKELNQ